jgi:peptidoglycan/xylan/chitin deacetylase (PgdA/CDA1 family)
MNTFRWASARQRGRQPGLQRGQHRGRLAAVFIAAVLAAGSMLVAPLSVGFADRGVRAASDVTPPSVPLGLTGVVKAKRYIRLTWQASTDNSGGAVRYRVFRDGVAVGTKTTATAYRDRPAAGTHSYKVRAIDAAGNKSQFSYTIWRTASKGARDTAPPTVPQGLSAAQTAQGAAALAWAASSDDRPGSVWYHVERDGMRIATVTATSFVDWRGGLKAAAHSYTVAAADGAGNVSGPSTAAAADVSPDLFPWAGIPTRNGSRLEPTVALTFDDGYRFLNVEKIAQILRENGAPATFFPTGGAIDLAPHVWADVGRDFPLGNHTYTHRNLNQSTPEVIEDQLVRTTLRIESATGRPMPALMRPPGGYNNTVAREVIKTLGLAICLWDIDTRDWDGAPSAELVTERALAARNGSVILLHDGDNVVQALPGIISGLRAKGFRLVTMNEMLGISWQPADR